MTTVHGSKTVEGLRRIEHGIEGAARLILLGAVKAAESSEKATALFHDRSGKTRESIKGSISPGGLSGRVVAGGAAAVLESGTKPHVITAKAGGMLRFYVNGHAIFRRSVHHPGTAARPFVGNARYLAERAIGYAAEIYINEAIAGI